MTTTSESMMTNSSESMTNSNQSIVFTLSSSLSSMTETASPFNFTGVFANIKDLTGNFTAMSLQYSTTSTNASQNANGSASYFVVGHPTMNGTVLTEVNITITGSSSSGTTNTSALVWFDSLGNVTQAVISGQTISGAQASFAGFLIYPFVIFFSYQNSFLGNATVFQYFHNAGTATETIGSVSMPVTTYQASNVVEGNATVQSATIRIGQIPGTNLHLTVEIDGQGYSTKNTGTESFMFKVLNLTKA